MSGRFWWNFTPVEAAWQPGTGPVIVRAYDGIRATQHQCVAQVRLDNPTAADITETGENLIQLSRIKEGVDT